MFFILPVRVEDNSPRYAVPLVNAILVAANVLIFWLGWSGHWVVGPGTRWLSVVTYAFAHANAWHLIGNMWCLLVFGNPVNRRLGNAYYLAAYFGTVVALGLFARLFCGGYLLGASGAIFAVIAMCVILMPSKLIQIYYFVMFPLSLLAGLVSRPPHWVYWFIRWDHFEVRALWAILVVPMLEIWGMFWWGWNWTNLGHLLGFFCGVGALLMMPNAITMRNRRPAWEL